VFLSQRHVLQAHMDVNSYILRNYIE